MGLEDGKRSVPDEGIQGFKRADFKTPGEVLGKDFHLEELPEGVRFYIKGQTVDLTNKRIVVNLYELVREDGGAKLRRDHLEKFINRIPEEEEIALKYGPSEEGYVWIAKWRDVTGDEKGMMSDTIRVSEKWRARYEDAQRKAKGAESLPVSPASAAPVPGSFGPLEMIRFMQEGEDRALRNMERMANVLRGSREESPAAVLKEAYQGATEIMQKAVETNLDMAKRVQKTAARNMETYGREDEEDSVDELPGGDPDPMAGVPAFLRPFIPQLETWLGTLLQGGPMGAAVKTLILSSEQWKEIFGDKDKFGLAVAAMEQHFGSERTGKAMDILLNRRSGKGKGK